MTIPPPGPLSYEGQVSIPYLNRQTDPPSPSSPSNQPFDVPTVWINTLTGKAWILTQNPTGAANWVQVNGGVNTLTGSSGGGIVNPINGNIALIAGTGITITGNTPSSGDITIAATGGSSGIITIDGDSGSVTGSTVTFTGANNGPTTTFSGSSTTMDLNLFDANSNLIISNQTVGTVTGSNNISIGPYNLGSLTTGSSNLALGPQSLPGLTTGHDNVCLPGGYNYIGAESSNILLASPGFVGESNTFRVGKATGTGSSEINAAFINGINGVTISSPNYVTIDPTTSQLGVTSSSPGGFDSINVLTFPPTLSPYTPSSGMNFCIIEVVGGGGGGGGNASTSGSQGASSGGGGGGGYARGLFSAATIGSSQTITIGAGGAGGTAGANNGSPGGTTSVGSLISATGGTGGIGGVATNGNIGSEGGIGGVGTGGDIQTSGTPGGYGISVNGYSINLPGPGGSSFFGGGARGTQLSAGINALSYGGGGSGAGSSTSSSAVAGGDGSDGIVIITEYIS